MICRKGDLPRKQPLYTAVLENSTCTEPDYKHDLILCIVFCAVSTIVMTACPKTQRSAHRSVLLFPFSFQPAYFILASFVSGIKKLDAEACRLLVLSWCCIPHTSLRAIGLFSCVCWMQHCRHIHKGKPEIGPFNLTNGKHKDAGLLLLLVKTATLSNVQAHQLSSAQWCRFEWACSFS